MVLSTFYSDVGIVNASGSGSIDLLLASVPTSGKRGRKKKVPIPSDVVQSSENPEQVGATNVDTSEPTRPTKRRRRTKAELLNGMSLSETP